MVQPSGLITFLIQEHKRSHGNFRFIQRASYDLLTFVRFYGDISERRNPAQRSLAEAIPPRTPSVRQIWCGFLVMVTPVYIRWDERGANQFEFGKETTKVAGL
jgi:hypothetical protein